MSALGLIICALIAGGCVPAILSGKTAPQTESKTDLKSGLLKPLIEDQSEKRQAATVPVRSETESGEAVSTKDDIRQEPNGTTRAAAKDSGTNARSEKSDRSKTATNPSTDSQTQVAAGSNAARREIARSSEAATAAAETGDLSKRPDPDVPIKRHDHSKYRELIRNKAEELVNQKKDSDHALMCKDAVTDQWSLFLYYSTDRSYTFKTYLWDEIDEKWEESIESEKRPLGGWQTHLRFQSAGKECATLKRARR